MPARRRAPEGCWLPDLQFSMSDFCMIRRSGSRQQNAKLFLREPLLARKPPGVGIQEGVSTGGNSHGFPLARTGKRHAQLRCHPKCGGCTPDRCPRAAESFVGYAGTTQSHGRHLYDFTISAPKSISVMANLGEDKRLIKAHRSAVAEALQELELYAAPPGSGKSRRTGTARPKTS